ncbi:UNC93-like protein 3-like [Hibiscus syriacus]|uniref:UNC93-like protein 3-like n=1 Tax=Hibiscus syriacus TaxID=106335 RepID=A0A6A3BL06_HIBSY|nr:UNC93-like protein 3-like [Hibiscus syriacus]
MILSFLTSVFSRLTLRWPVLLYAATWTFILTAMVAVASFSPEFAFVYAVSESSSFSKACGTEGLLRVPMDVAGEKLCLPVHLFGKSKIDWIIPPVFAALIVTGSAWVVRGMGLWEFDDAQ